MALNKIVLLLVLTATFFGMIEGGNLEFEVKNKLAKCRYKG